MCWQEGSKVKSQPILSLILSLSSLKDGQLCPFLICVYDPGSPTFFSDFLLMSSFLQKTNFVNV
jgi:hypothetical protein